MERLSTSQPKPAHQLAVLDIAHAPAWPEMFAHLEHVFDYRLHVAQVAKLDLAQPLDEALPRQPVLQAFEPQESVDGFQPRSGPVPLSVIHRASIQFQDRPCASGAIAVTKGIPRAAPRSAIRTAKPLDLQQSPGAHSFLHRPSPPSKR